MQKLRFLLRRKWKVIDMFESLGRIYEKPYIIQYAEKIVQEIKSVINMQYGNLNQTPAKSPEDVKMCIALSNLMIVFRQELKNVLNTGEYSGVIDYNVINQMNEFKCPKCGAPLISDVYHNSGSVKLLGWKCPKCDYKEALKNERHS